MSDITNLELLHRIKDIEAKHSLFVGYTADLQRAMVNYEKATAELSPTLARLEKSQREIMAAIRGDDYGNVGVVGRLDALEKAQQAQADQIAGHDRRIYAGGIILSAVWAIFLLLKDRIFK